MKIIHRVGLYGLLPAASCLLACGCAKMPATAATQPAVQADAVPAMEIHSRVRDVDHKLATLEGQVANLPGSGSTAQEVEKNHRELMRDSFGTLADVLPLLEGNEPSGDFQYALRVVQGSKTQLANGSMELTAEPAIDTGLRAVARLLEIVNRDAFAGDGEIAKGIESVNQRAGDLDSNHGPLHRVVAGQVMVATTGVLRQMAQVLSDKAGPATRPATPSEAPKAEPPKPDAAAASAE